MKKIGRYEIVEELGHGAMGVVYKASDPTIGRLVAVKVLSFETCQEEPGVPSASEIFMREARAAGRLSHPGIVTIYDALEDAETRKSYLVMEFVPGRTLENILLSEAPPSPEKSLDIVRQLAEALEYAHNEQIIHRDLKPANILLTAKGRAKITDFGIAKILAREGAQRTAAVMGTPSYMSPEQVAGGEIGARADLFSLGILLYFMLTGEKPFTGDTAAVMFKIVYQDPVPPSRVRPQLHAGYDYLVLRCLAKHPQKRYASAREFLDDLDDVQHGRAPRSEAKFPLADLAVGERTVAAAPPMIFGPRRPEASGPKISSSRFMAAAIGAVILVSLAALGIHLRGRSHGLPPAPAATPRSPAPVPLSGASARPVTPALPNKSGEPSSSSPGPTGQEPPATLEAAAREEAVLAARKRTARLEPEVKLQPAAKPAGAATPSANSSQATKPSSGAAQASSNTPHLAPSNLQVRCKYELKEGTLTVLSDAKTILQANLKGKKKGGFLGIKGAYYGILSRPITIPAGSRVLAARFVSEDGSVDLTNSISAMPPPAATMLQVEVRTDHLKLRWAAGPARK